MYSQILINKDYPLPPNFIPRPMVTPSVPFHLEQNEPRSKTLLVPEAALALEDLAESAGRAGLSVWAVSAYRSYRRQKELYDRAYFRAHGTSPSQPVYVAPPGCSEHQSGLAVDVSCPQIRYGLEDTFADTPEGLWLAEHCWESGFILRYPKGRESVTGYQWEPWHLRYVGRDMAELLMKRSLTLEEYYLAV